MSTKQKTTTQQLTPSPTTMPSDQPTEHYKTLTVQCDSEAEVNLVQALMAYMSDPNPYHRQIVINGLLTYEL